MIIDLAWNIHCWNMLDWCRKHEVLYVNTSIEEWDPYGDEKRTDPTKYTLYARHMLLRKKMAKHWKGVKGTTFKVIRKRETYQDLIRGERV